MASATKEEVDSTSYDINQSKDAFIIKEEEKCVKRQFSAMPNTSFSAGKSCNIGESPSDIPASVDNQSMNRKTSEIGSVDPQGQADPDELMSYYPRQVQKILKKKRVSKESKPSDC